MLLNEALHVRVVHEILFVRALALGALAVAALLQRFRFAERMIEDDARGGAEFAGQRLGQFGERFFRAQRVEASVQRQAQDALAIAEEGGIFRLVARSALHAAIAGEVQPLLGGGVRGDGGSGNGCHCGRCGLRRRFHHRRRWRFRSMPAP